MIGKSHLYEEKYNNQGCLMKIVEDNSYSNIVVEFQDKYKARVKTQYCNFSKGSVKNPYHPVIYGVGIAGNKYKTVDENSKSIKEYTIWYHILQRCFDKKYIKRHPAYQNVTVCKEWLYFPNFYEWLHNQSNFNKWYKGSRWAVDKDILNKGNKTYSPENCCIIPQNVNCLFLKREAERGQYPIGVYYNGDGFVARCRNPLIDKVVELGCYSTPEKAFYLGYKPYKENIIKQVAQIEYDAGNITKQCYDAMMNYKVEITD